MPVVREVGAGDALIAEFVVQYRLKGRPAREALAEALNTAALWVSGQPLAHPATGTGSALDADSRSWAETAL